MNDLVMWLRTQIDADEAAAQDASPEDSARRWAPRECASCSPGAVCTQTREEAHIARHDPARVLADVAAKRAIVDMHWQWADDDGQPLALCDACSDEWPCRTLRHLAYAYHVAGAEGWREEWRP